MTDLPDGWDLKSLSSLVTLLSGFAYKSSDWKESGVPVLKITNVRNGLVRLEGCSYISKERATESKQFAVHNNDLLITMTGEIGATGFYREEFEARLNQRVGKLVVKEGEPLNLKYLAYFFESPETRQEMWKLAKGIAQANISPKEILNLEIPLPPLPEQHKIVEILEDHLSRLDAALADVKQAKEKAAQFRRSLLQAAFTGNLVSDEKHTPTTQAIFRLSEICSFITDGSHNPPKGIESSEYLMLSSRDINDGKLTFEKPRYLSADDFEIENRRTNLQVGDVLLTTVGSIGRTALYSGTPKNVTFQRSVSVLRPKIEMISPKFLMYYLDSITEMLNRESRGVAQQGIYLNQVRKLEVPVPPLLEQHKIVEILEDHLSRLDAAVALADAIEKQSAGLRRSILQAAFTGQLTKEVASV